MTAQWKIRSFMCAVVAFFASNAFGQLERATVKAETLAVYSEMSAKSDVIKTIKKGNVVRIEMEMLGSEGNWCRITEEGQTMSLGFLLCEFLDRPEQKLELVGPSIIEKPSAAIEADTSKETRPSISVGRKKYAKITDEQERLLRAAFVQGDTVTVKALLDQGIDPNFFMTYSRNIQPEMIKLLINSGADVNAGDVYGMTPLMLVATTEHTESVKMLIDAGADVNMRDKHAGMTALMQAAPYGRTKNMILLIKAGADIDAKEHYYGGMTALMIAARDGVPDAVKLLLKNGARVNVRTKYGKTALRYARELRDSLAEELSSSRKFALKYPDIETDRKRIAGMQSALARYEEVVDLLLKVGSKE